MAQGNRNPTLEDVARAAGVSRALVSIVMREAPGASDATRARVLAVADRLGYRPDARARLLARSSTRLLGVVYRVNALHHVDLLAPIYDAAEAARYEVILSGRTRSHDERRAVNTLLAYRCEAVLMLGPDLEEAEINRVAASIPVVLAGRRMKHPATTVDSIRTDEDEALGMAVAYLAALGHQRIAHVDGGSGTISADRRRAYEAQMRRHGLGDDLRIIAGDGTAASGQRAAEEVLALEPRPTALIAFNDEAALAVMRTLRHRGLVIPDDMSVVGFDGSSLSRLAPRELTTIRQDADAIGRQAVARAIARLDEPSATSIDRVLPPTLVEGETTAPPPGAEKRLPGVPDRSRFRRP